MGHHPKDHSRSARWGHAAGRAIGPIFRKTFGAFSRAIRPLYQSAAETANKAPYSVKYVVAVLLAQSMAIGLWAFHVVGMAWLIHLFFGTDILVVAVIYFPILVWLNQFSTDEDRLPSLRRVFGLWLLRKH
jgi:hypothetical protein